MRRLILATALCALAAPPVIAQQPQKGTWEIGGFGRWNRYDSSFDQIDSTKNKNSFGGGARVGYFFSPRWSLELDGSINPTDVDRPGGATSVGLVYLPFHLRALYNAPLGERVSWLFGVGPNYNRYNVSSEADEFLTKTFEGDDWGIGALTGFRFKLSERWSVRLSGTVDFIPSPQNDADGSNTMLGAQAGLSLFLGGKCTDRIDSIRVEPRTQNIFVGDRASLRANGYRCDGQVVDLTGTSTARLVAGGGTMMGLTFTAGSEAGCYEVEVNNASAKRPTDRVQICVQARPVAVTLDRCEIVPSTATTIVDQPVEFRVMGYYSDGTSRELTDATLNADGGTITNRTYRSAASGEYVITAQCGAGRSARATVTVRSINITLRALFQFDRTNIFVQAERDSLRMLADLLRQHPGLNLTIYGHTDWVGSVDYNAALGQRRIRAVLDTLANYGVDRARMATWATISYGECQPVADNRTRDGRALNRRVEIFDTPSAKRYEGSSQCRERP